MDSSPLVSVVIPAYNVENEVRKCLESVICQTYQNLEIIIINDGSTDRTGKIIRECLRDVDESFIYDVSNGGLSSARNIGVKHSHGDLITFVDSDDYIDEDYVAYLVEMILNFDVDIASCQHRILLDENKCTDLQFNGKPEVWSSHRWLKGVLARNTVDLSAWGKIYKRSLCLKFPFPTGKLYEDTFTTYKDVLEAGCIAVGNESKYTYKIRLNSISRSSFSKSSLDLIKATEKMTVDTLRVFPDLKPEVRLRRSWAYTSVLNAILTSNKENEYTQLVDDLRVNIIHSRPVILSRKNIDRRLKLVVLALSAGLRPYILLLKLKARLDTVNALRG